MSDVPLLASERLGPNDHVDPIVLTCDRLLAVLCDASHGWRIAAAAIDDEELAGQMLEMATEKEGFAVTLAEIILQRAGEIPHDHTGRGALLNWWLELRAAMTHGKRDTILRICHTGSKALVREYERALKGTSDPAVHDVLVYQARRVERGEEWLASIS